ncbi:MAG: hypothetical protein AB1716_08620 [Planctomycetota bacterium]
MRNWDAPGAALLSVMALGICGCPPDGGRGLAPFPPPDRATALASINENLARINQPVRLSGNVTFRFRDAEDKSRSVSEDANLEFIGPRSLLLEVRALTGKVAELGSNNEQYWVYVDLPDYRKLWWGTWAALGPQTERRLPVPPNELLDALLLRPLPLMAEGGLAPLLRTADGDFRLLYIRLGADRQPIGWREVRLDDRPPWQPREIIDRTPEGTVLMHALLSDYKRIGDDGPYTPRRYIVRWPLDEAELRLDISRARFRPDAAPIESPVAGFRGEVESIDAPPPPGGARQP